MDWIKCEDKLPESSDIDVVGYGPEYKTVNRVRMKKDLYEVGFRSSVDDPTKPFDWIDFSFKVTHWAYLQPPNKVDSVCTCNQFKAGTHYCEKCKIIVGGLKQD